MSRLASFKGPSTPTTSPVQHRHYNAPTSPARTSESTFHRKTRTYLQELRSITRSWDDLVLIDGLRAAQAVVDTRTDLDNILAQDREPGTHLVGSRLAFIEKKVEELDVVVSKLWKQFNRMSSVVDNMEMLLAEAYKVKGWQWVCGQPLWVTWSLGTFIISIPEILIPYHRALVLHIELVDKLRSHSVSFEDSRNAISTWMEQPSLEDFGWESKWEDLCLAEVERWNK